MITFTFVEGAPLKQLEQRIEEEMQKSLAHFEKELVKIRTGRAHPAMVSDIKLAVAAYGGNLMPLKDLAAISAPEPQLLVVQPWDKSLIGEIEKAISLANIGANPVNDGTLIRIALPKMSGSRRKELSTILSQQLEECRIGIRRVRQEFHNLIRTAEKDKKISEDYSKRLQTTLQKLTEKLTEKAESAANRKEQEISSL